MVPAEKAPAEIVAKKREDLVLVEESLVRLNQRLSDLDSIE